MTDVVVETKDTKKFDPEAFAMNIAKAMENSGRALAAFLKPRESGELKDNPPNEIAEVVKTFTAVAEYWLTDNARSSDLQTRIAKDYLDLWGSSVRRLAGEEVRPAIEPSPRDKRFKDPEWKSNQYFDFLMQLYLLTTRWAQDLVRDAEGIDPHTRKKAASIGRAFGMTSEQALASPMLLIGTPESCVAQLQHRAKDWGVSQFIFITRSEKVMRLLAEKVLPHVVG